MKNEIAESTASPEHGGKVSTDEEEERQAKSVNGEVSRAVKVVLMQVLRRPEVVVPEGEKAMQDDAEEHGRSAEGIQMVVAGRGAGHAGLVLQPRGL